MPNSNYPSGFAHGVTIRGMPLLSAYPGKVIWVDSQTGADANSAGTFDRPLATIDKALQNASGTTGGFVKASRGDIVVVKSGHAETTTAAITMDVAGVAIIGLGVGRARPTITANFAAAGDSLTATAANCAIINLRFAPSSASQTAQVNVGAADFSMERCVIEQGASNLIGVTVASGAHRFSFLDDLWLGTAAGPDYAIFFDSAADVADDWEVRGCTFNFVNSSGLDLGFLYAINATVGYVIDDCVMLGADAVALDFNSIASAGIGGDGLMRDCAIVPSSSVGTIANLLDAGGTAFVNVRVHNAQDDTSGALIPATTAS